MIFRFAVRTAPPVVGNRYLSVKQFNIHRKTDKMIKISEKLITKLLIQLCRDRLRCFRYVCVLLGTDSLFQMDFLNVQLGKIFDVDITKDLNGKQYNFVKIRPMVWPKLFPQAGGLLQSPVNIETSKSTNDMTLKSKPLYWNYCPEMCTKIINTGYGWKVDATGGEGSELSGGPLGHKYKLEQFHCHWGCTSTKGSEHTVDGMPYAGELHLVHWNCDKYNSFSEAIAHPDGLAVLGVFLQVFKIIHTMCGKWVIENFLKSYAWFTGATALIKYIETDQLQPPL
ncbi:hypothetical protein AGLY_000510 [Aphis glycines]|uniref:Carbonic anhydrase n=1 Tax=Aphis glycines TaxID=307491 RepID=A0A6G0U7P1_APHGL|nr:hypothetical protein AGLY_000510 [Aphis glycines]